MSEREIRNGGSGEGGSGSLSGNQERISSGTGGQNGRDVNQGGKHQATEMAKGHEYAVSKH